MRKIKIAIIHSKYNEPLPHEWMGGEGFSFETAMSYVSSNLDKTMGFIHKAGQSRADIVCTGECFLNSGIYARDDGYPGMFAEIVSKSSAAAKEKMSEAAKKYSMYIATNTYEYAGDDIYNMSTLYGRNGEIAGQYKKVHLADGERATLIKPGDEFNIIKTDIGNIGFFTCYDVIFPEACRLLALNGADIVIHQTQGWGSGGKSFCDSAVGEAYMRVRAAENSVYLIVAKCIMGGALDGGRSMVVDNSGLIIAESETAEEALLEVEIEPDYDILDKYNYDNVFAGVESTKARQLIPRRPDLYRELINEAPFIISTRYKDMKLINEPTEMKKVIDDLNKIDTEERSKYHW